MTTETAPKPRPGNLAVAFVFITVLLDMIGFGLIIPVMPALIAEVGHVELANAAVIGGWMFFVFSAMQFIFGPTMGSLSDAFGRRPMLLLAVFGLFVDYLMMSFAPTLFWLFVGRAVAGLCGASYVIANAYIADITPPEGRAKAFGLMGAAFGVGFVIGPALGGILGGFGTRMPFYAAALLSLVNLLYGWFVLPETLPRDKRRSFEWSRANPFGTFKVFATYKGVLPLCAIMGLYFFASSVYQAIWPFWGEAKFGWDPWMIGITLSVFGIVMALFQGLLTGPAVKAFGEGRVVMIGLISSVLGAVGYGLAPNLVWVIVFFLVHGPEGFVHPMLSALMSKAVPEDAQGELQGGISSVMSVAMLAGTVFFAQVFGHFMAEGAVPRTPDMGFFVAALILLATVGAYLVVRQRQAA